MVRRRQEIGARSLGADSSDNIGGMDAITFPPAPGQRAQPHLRAGHPRAEDAGATSWPGSSGASTPSAPTSTAASGPAAAPRSRSSSRTTTSTCSAPSRARRPATPSWRSAAALDAAPDWRAMSIDDRCAILLKAADLLAGPWRQRINAATMLGQSKTAFQAEIDAACELIDFWRFNVHYAKQILHRPADREQPRASGTAPTTGRSRASSTRSRRSTSPRSPATCRPRRR